MLWPSAAKRPFCAIDMSRVVALEVRSGERLSRWPAGFCRMVLNKVSDLAGVHLAKNRVGPRRQYSTTA